MKPARVLAVLLLVAPAMAACTSSSTNEHHIATDATVTQPVTVVVVVNGVGGVTVHTGTSARITIHRAIDYHGATPPQPGQELRNGTLELTANCTNCGIAYDLTVPSSVGVTITDSVGAVTVDGIAGPVIITTTTGHVQGTGLRAATVSVRASAGAIDLSFSSAPTQVTAHSVVGAISVEVPGGPYAVDAATKVGVVHVNVANSPTAANHLTLTTNVGMVTVNAAAVP